jgi:hypothetical protein
MNTTRAWIFGSQVVYARTERVAGELLSGAVRVPAFDLGAWYAVENQVYSLAQAVELCNRQGERHAQEASGDSLFAARPHRTEGDESGSGDNVVDADDRHREGQPQET